MPKVISKKPIEISQIRRILIRATNWVGDAVMTLPALERVRENFPKSHISIIAKPWVAPLFADHPALDQVILYRKREGIFTDLGETIRIVRVIRKNKFDLAILFQNAFEAAFLAFLGGVRFRLGYNTDGRGFLLTHPIVRNEEITATHQVEYYLALLKKMGWEASSMDPILYVSQDDVRKGNDILKSAGIKRNDFLIGLSPGAIYGKAKQWPPDRFAKIGDWAAERWGAKVIVMGSQKEIGICDALCRAMTYSSINFCGKTTLREAIGMMSLFYLFVTNDSGLMHISGALGLPTVAIFGSTDPVATGPRGNRAVIVKHDTACAPCLQPECPKGDIRCFLTIKPDEVWTAMERLRETL